VLVCVRKLTVLFSQCMARSLDLLYGFQLSALLPLVLSTMLCLLLLKKKCMHIQYAQQSKAQKGTNLSNSNNIYNTRIAVALQFIKHGDTFAAAFIALLPAHICTLLHPCVQSNGVRMHTGVLLLLLLRCMFYYCYCYVLFTLLRLLLVQCDVVMLCDM
jgi:hypothetical protein